MQWTSLLFYVTELFFTINCFDWNTIRSMRQILKVLEVEEANTNSEQMLGQLHLNQNQGYLLVHSSW